MPDEKKQPQSNDTRSKEAIERQNQLTRFLRAIKSKEPMSEELKNWWMHQY